jgi:hypothetical protein
MFLLMVQIINFNCHLWMPQRSLAASDHRLTIPQAGAGGATGQKNTAFAGSPA